MARKGIEFELKPKEITIYDLKLIEQVGDNQFKFDIICSSGTYIRSIARDLAELLGTYGCMSFLERTETGIFTIKTSIALDEILKKNLDDCLLSPLDVFNNFDIVEIDQKLFTDVLNGKRPSFKKLNNQTFIIYNNDIVGVAKLDSDELILDTFLY